MKKTSKRNAIVNDNVQYYFNLGECPKGMGSNPALTPVKFGHKFTKEDAASLGGFRDKNNVLKVGYVIDEKTYEKFVYDCNTRGESMMFRFTCIILNKYPKLGNKKKLMGPVYSGLSCMSLHANTDYMKRSGIGKINSGSPRKLHFLKFKGKYENIYQHMITLCNELHVTMSTLIGATLEQVYVNYNKPSVIYKEVVEAERKLAKPYMHIDRGYTQYAYGMGCVRPMTEEEFELFSKKVEAATNKVRTRISQIRNRKRSVKNIGFNSPRMLSRQDCINKLDAAIKSM